ncbi:MAG: AAA family ATPase, partial [Candidatus Odinarchaeota archaeon]
MRILYLKLHNFLSYHEQSFNLGNYTAVALMGDNGAGKSAVLDAITWVLFGRARGTDAKGSGSDKLLFDCLSQDLDKVMSVTIVFSLENEIYRIERSQDFSRSRSPQRVSIARLIESFDELGDDFSGTSGQDLSRNTLKDNNKLISKKLLGMDYETFITSCFFLQNRYDLFMQKTATERKKIIIEILGLEKFELLRKEAKQRKDDIKEEVKSLKEEIDTAKGEIDNRPSYILQKKTKMEEFSEIEKNLDNLQESSSKKSLVVKQLENEIETVKKIGEEVTGIENEIKMKSEQLKKQEIAYERYKNLLINDVQIEKNFTIADKEKKRYEELFLKKVDESQLKVRITEIGNDLREVNEKLAGLTSERDRAKLLP